MPFNVTSGSCVTFTAEFFDAGQNLTTPPSGTLTIVYTNTVGSTAQAAIALIPSGAFFVAPWDTSVAMPGFANVSISAPGAINTPAATVQVRIMP